MADNGVYQATTPATLPSGFVVSDEEVTTLNGGAVAAQHAQRVILAMRTGDGTVVDITPGESLPSDDAETRTVIGATMEAVAGSDTAASGLNGLLKRALQHLTTLIGRLPATLGQKTKANSLAVTLASDSDGLPTVAAGTSTHARITAATGATTLLAANTARLGATVFNDSTAILKIKFGASPTSTSFTHEMAGGGLYEVPFRYTGVITGVWTAADGGAANVAEFTP